VEYEPEMRKIFVSSAGGQKIPAECLSRGTHDQLYLAIRIVLGEKGFFIQVLESENRLAGDFTNSSPRNCHSLIQDFGQ